MEGGHEKKMFLCISHHADFLHRCLCGLQRRLHLDGEQLAAAAMATQRLVFNDSLCDHCALINTY